MSILMKTANQLPLKLSLVATLFALMMPVASVHAQGVDLNKVPPVNEPAPMSEADIKAKMKRAKEVKPYNKNDLSFELILPKDWSDNTQPPPIGPSMDQKLSKTVLSVLGKFVSPPKNLVRSHITIEALDLPYEISAKNWVVNYILTSGFSLTGMTEKSNKELEVLYVQVDGDQPYVVRGRAVINGSTLSIIRYYLPQENQKEDEALQAQVVNSYTMLSPSKEGIEPQEKYGFLDQSYFNYPASWDLKDKSILSIERMSALLSQVSRREAKDDELFLDGHIKINVISKLLKTTLDEEIATFRDELIIPGYTLGKMIEKVNYNYNRDIKSGKAQIYELQPSDPVKMSPYEFLVTVMEGEEYYYIISMVTPSRDQDFLTWAQNIEAARTVIESTRRQSVSIEEDANDPYYDYLKEEGAQ